MAKAANAASLDKPALADKDDFAAAHRRFVAPLPGDRLEGPGGIYQTPQVDA